MAASAVNDQERHLQLKLQALEKEDDRRRFAENAKRKIAEQEKYRHRYDTFEDNRDSVMSEHYNKVILPKVRQASVEDQRREQEQKERLSQSMATEHIKEVLKRNLEEQNRALLANQMNQE